VHGLIQIWVQTGDGTSKKVIEALVKEYLSPDVVQNDLRLAILAVFASIHPDVGIATASYEQSKTSRFCAQLHFFNAVQNSHPHICDRAFAELKNKFLPLTIDSVMCMVSLALDPESRYRDEALALLRQHARKPRVTDLAEMRRCLKLIRYACEGKAIRVDSVKSPETLQTIREQLGIPVAPLNQSRLATLAKDTNWAWIYAEGLDLQTIYRWLSQLADSVHHDAPLARHLLQKALMSNATYSTGLSEVCWYNLARTAQQPLVKEFAHGLLSPLMQSFRGVTSEILSLASYSLYKHSLLGSRVPIMKKYLTRKTTLPLPKDLCLLIWEYANTSQPTWFERLGLNYEYVAAFVD
jgi:hypothetical protein